MNNQHTFFNKKSKRDFVFFPADFPAQAGHKIKTLPGRRPKG
jgi:hypothetical protein